MTGDRAGGQWRDALAPLADALLAAAEQDASQTLAAADDAAASRLARARRDAASLLAEARAKGADEGAASVSAERTRAQRRASALLLSTRLAAVDEFRAAARAAVEALRDDPDYPSMLQALHARALRDLGPTATVTQAPGGGIVAEAGQRRADYSLAALADDVCDAMQSQVGEVPA